MSQSESIAKNAISGMRKVLTGKGRAGDCWDSKLSNSEKRVLLLTAKMKSDVSFKYWADLQESEKTAIYNAAYRASQWASMMGMLNDFPEVEEVAA